MLYYLFTYLDKLDFPGAGVFQYISFRSAMAVITSLIISLIIGRIIILASIIIPTLLFAKLHNIYIIILLVTTIWLGFMGFIDDYIKVFKHDKQEKRENQKYLDKL